ncbi:hypothetical protein HKX48_006061 [Thoreauomyces humboldtii]|nr:hypothetical protein HKX48_006061 [Thoreauomyces humboldtii]
MQFPGASPPSPIPSLRHVLNEIIHRCQGTPNETYVNVHTVLPVPSTSSLSPPSPAVVRQVEDEIRRSFQDAGWMVLECHVWVNGGELRLDARLGVREEWLLKSEDAGMLSDDEGPGRKRARLQ